MKWRVKNANNQRCIVSDCGDYVVIRTMRRDQPAYSLECRGHWMITTDSADKAKQRAEEHKSAKEKAA